jgi:hypothetical protein
MLIRDDTWSNERDYITAREAASNYNNNHSVEIKTIPSLFNLIRELSLSGCYEVEVCTDSHQFLHEMELELHDAGFRFETNHRFASIFISFA